MKSDKTIDQLGEDFLEYLLVEKNCSPLTIRNYRHYLKRFSQWLDKNYPALLISDLDLDIIRKYRAYLARFTDKKSRNLSLITQSYHVIALRSFLKWLHKNDYKTLAPEKIDLPKTRSRSLKFLNHEQVERLLSQPNLSTMRGLRDKAILEIIFSTGLRVSEVSRLNRDQVDLRRREFGVIGKGGRARVVFLSHRAVKWLDRYLQQRQDKAVSLFIGYRKAVVPAAEIITERIKRDQLTDEHLRLTPRSIQRIVKKYSKKAKLPMEVTPHVIRHAFATDLLMAGADLRSVQEMLGHKNIATTQIYTHVTNKQLKNVHDAFHGKGG